MYNRYHKERTIEENKTLVKKYPFLNPVHSINHGSMFINSDLDEFSKHYDYSYTQLDDMPDGWNYSFGEQMCEEILQALIKNGIDPNDYVVQQVKEKYGTLRWYDYHGCEDVDNIIDKYEELSEQICQNCGKKKAKYMTTGWIGFFCEDCVQGIEGRDYKRLDEEEN